MTPSTHDFIAGIRSAASMFAPTSHAAEKITPQSEIEGIQAAMRGAALWLVASTYDEYEDADFSSIPDEPRQELHSCIHRLRDYISQFSPEQAPPRAIYEAAAPIFLQVTKLIQNHYPSNV